MQRQAALSRVEPARRSAVTERNASGSEVSQHHGGISGPSRRADDGRRVALAQSHGRPLPPLQPPPVLGSAPAPPAGLQGAAGRGLRRPLHLDANQARRPVSPPGRAVPPPSLTTPATPSSTPINPTPTPDASSHTCQPLFS